MGGGGINFDFNANSELVATTSDGAVITTSSERPMSMFLYPAPQGIAPTEFGRNGAICAFPRYGYCGCCLHALNACAIHSASRSYVLHYFPWKHVHEHLELCGGEPLHLQLRT